MRIPVCYVNQVAVSLFIQVDHANIDLTLSVLSSKLFQVN